MREHPAQSKIVDSPGFFFIPAVHLYPPELLRGHEDTPILMVEDQQACSRRAYHQQKLTLLLASMRHYREEAQSQGFRVNYFDLNDNCTIRASILKQAVAQGVDRFTTFAVTDRPLRRLLAATAKEGGLEWQELSDPGFIEPYATFESAMRGKSLRMDSYYKQKRKRLQIMMMKDGKPEGGRWSFDSDNRKKIKKSDTIPAEPIVSHDAITEQTMRDVEARFANHPGNARDLWLPTDRGGARVWLDTFVNDRLFGFGTFEDAMTQRGWLLFHSGLSPLLNIGLLTANEVLDAVLGRSDAPINDREGFVRQLLGWREFVRGVYLSKPPHKTLQNKRNHTRQMTHHWFDATTGIPPLDAAIRTMQSKGWNHHIERLMVFANLMNLCEIHPQSVYEYFMTHHIDAYDWVMQPNVEDMGLSSCEDSFATKPYICGSNYLLKMSDYAKGLWCDAIDGLYWRFVERNREELESNARTVLAVKAMDRVSAQRRQLINVAADQFLERCTISA